MYTILLTPQDTLLFRDTRAMPGSPVEHSAYLPLPHIFSNSLRSAFHRAELDRRAADAHKYGSLITAGPFPVSPKGAWYLPAPADLVKSGNAVKIGIRLVISENPSSLPKPLTYALGAVEPAASSVPTAPTYKDGQLPEWITVSAYKKYLAGKMPVSDDFKMDTDIGCAESRGSIGIDPDTRTRYEDSLHSAQYLRLKDGWRLGGFAEARDEKDGDLIEKLLLTENKIIIGGQQGVCSIEKSSDTQAGGFADLTSGVEFHSRFLKWVLLSPAVFPEIAASEIADPKITNNDAVDIRYHPGGWLPNWIDPENGKVLLRETVERKTGESRDVWRSRARKSGEINGRLIAARIPGSIEISGWSLEYGEKPTQLAVPAGAIYYFECADESAAQKLAAALNFPNRRSTLFGEKGFGIGICASLAESEILHKI